MSNFVEFDMRSWISHNGVWRLSPDILLETVYNIKDTPKKILFNFLDCVDIQFSGAIGILEYICALCQLDSSRVIIACYEPLEVKYATVVQGNPMALASMLSYLDLQIDNTKFNKKFLALFSRFTIDRLRMTKFLTDNCIDSSIMPYNINLEDIHINTVQKYPDGDDLYGWASKNLASTSVNRFVHNSSVPHIVEETIKFKNEYLIEIVLETSHRIKNVVTEKTMKSFIFGKPFIVYAAPGYLAMLRDMGFKTFSPFINEEYDLVDDDIKRFDMLKKEITRLNSYSIDELKVQAASMNEILEYNRILFRTESYDLKKIKWSKQPHFFTHDLIYS